MSKLTEAKVKAEYNSFKNSARNLLKNKEYERCMAYIALCGKIAYKFNFWYSDPELEEFLSEIGSSVVKPLTISSEAERYVFYDYFGLDNRGLTQQYIRALIHHGKEFLYVLDGEGLPVGPDILNEIQSYSKAKVFKLSASSYLGKIKELESAVTDYNPQKAFLHLAPWDVVAVSFWSTYKIPRYFINLTDHAFWFGVNSADYYFEFRHFGCKVSSEARGIPKEKLLLLPYYPIQQKSAFLGFPTDTTGKIIGFSGASYYKIHGRKNTFLKLIGKALKANENFIFFFAGSGNRKPILDFIHSNGLEERFFLLGDRADIAEVFNRIDIFINTYPVAGALMSQLAVVSSKPIVSFTTPDLACNLIEDILLVDKTKARSMFTEREFLDELNLLISDETYRARNVLNFAGSVPKETEFEAQLFSYLDSTKSTQLPDYSVSVDYKAMADLHLDIENALKTYHFLKLTHLKLDYFYKFPFKAVESLASVWNSHQPIIKKAIKKGILSMFVKT